MLLNTITIIHIQCSLCIITSHCRSIKLFKIYSGVQLPQKNVILKLTGALHQIDTTHDSFGMHDLMQRISCLASQRSTDPSWCGRCGQGLLLLWSVGQINLTQLEMVHAVNASMCTPTRTCTCSKHCG